MAQQVKGLVTKPEGLSSILQLTWGKERTKLSSDRHRYTVALAPIPTHLHIKNKSFTFHCVYKRHVL